PSPGSVPPTRPPIAPSRRQKFPIRRPGHGRKPPPMALKGKQFPAASRIPHLRRSIVTPRRQPLAIGRPGHGDDTARMALERERFSAADCVPYLRRAIRTPRRHPFAVRRPRYPRYPIPLADERRELQVVQAVTASPVEAPDSMGLGLRRQGAQTTHPAGVPGLLPRVDSRRIALPALLLLCRSCPVRLVLRALIGRENDQRAD